MSKKEYRNLPQSEQDSSLNSQDDDQFSVELNSLDLDEQELNEFDFDFEAFDIVENSKKSNLKMAFMNMANSILGAGAIGTPFAMRNCGFVGGILALITLTILVDFTIQLIVINMKLAGKKSYQETVQHSFGNYGKIIILLAQGLFAFGGCIGFSIIIGDTFPHILRSFFPSYKTNSVLNFLFERNFVIFIVTLCISFPLSALKDISKLAKTSALALLSMLIIITIVLVRGPQMPQDLKGSLSLSGILVTPRIFQGISVISFALVCHHNTSFIFHSLKDPSLKRFAKVTHASCFVSFIAIGLIGIGGYAIFQNKTKGNILNNFPSDDPIVNIARFCFGLNMLTTFPLEIFVLRDVLKDLIYINHTRSPEFSNLKHLLFTAVLVFSTMGIALTTCNLGALLELIGATTASLMAYILPPLCNLQMTWNSKSFKQKIPYVGCIIFGFLVMFISSSQTIFKALHETNEPHCVE